MLAEAGFQILESRILILRRTSEATVRKAHLWITVKAPHSGETLQWTLTIERLEMQTILVVV